MTVDVVNKDGGKAGSVELPASVFGVEPNEHAMYQAVRSYLASRRQGTAKTKGRSEVRGTGKKPFRQKGTGGARRGSNRSPLLVGGGTIHGPKPHFYSVDLPTKVKRLARKSALSHKLKGEGLVVVEDFTMDAPKTKQYLNILGNLKASEGKSLLVINADDKNVYMSSRNLKNTKVVNAADISSYDILNARTVILAESSVETIQNNLK